MRNVLIQLDTDPFYSSFDAIAALDAGADVLLPYAGVTPEAVREIVAGAIFTRGGQDLRHTAIFIGGYDVSQGEAILETIRKSFFGGFRVSVLLDSRGCNTTAAAAVARITRAVDVRGRKVVVVGGTGPVGQRVAGLFGQQGAQVYITSIRQDWLDAAVAAIRRRFAVEATPLLVQNDDAEAYRQALAGATVAFGAGPAGVRMLPLAAWSNVPELQVVADLNATQPQGVEGLEMGDDGVERYGKRCFGPIGLGNFKMKVHRAAIAALFERKDRVLDAEELFTLAQSLL